MFIIQFAAVGRVADNCVEATAIHYFRERLSEVHREQLALLLVAEQPAADVPTDERIAVLDIRAQVGQHCLSKF